MLNHLIFILIQPIRRWDLTNNIVASLDQLIRQSQNKLFMIKIWLIYSKRLGTCNVSEFKN